MNLAALYEWGEDVTRDETKALKRLTKAADLGQASERYGSGVEEHLACRTGQAGTPAEGQLEALKWIRLTGAEKCPDAAFTPCSISETCHNGLVS